MFQIPPPAPSLNVVVAPAHTWVMPEMAVGAVLNVTTMVAIQPVAGKNVIVDVPGVMPVTIPVVAPMVATVVRLLLQVPPVMDEPNVPDVPVQIPVAPDITGIGLMLMVFVATQLPIE